MRMPILSYFLVTGTVLVGLMIWAGSEAEPNSPALKTSQIVGLPKPFKAPPETSQHRITGVNFAAERDPPAPKPVKAAEAPRKQKVSSKYSKMPTWNWLAEYPYSRLSVH